MTTNVDKLEQNRIEKMRQIEEAGRDPWGERFDGRQPLAVLRDLAPPPPTDPETYSGEETATVVRAAGRVLAIRGKGKMFFLDLHDKSGKIQLVCRKDKISEADFELLKKLDLWDLIGVDGNLGRTKAGEVSIFVTALHMHAKTLAHPPEKYHGAQDLELLLRRRYIDMVQSPEVIERFQTRSRIIQFIREFLTGRGFIEVETPTMHSIAGGAAARPFVTHHNALDLDLFMRIALELPLKRLLVGGMERVFEIGRVWRNEGIDATHNPEFTMLELYEAYGNYETIMDLTEGVIAGAVALLGKGMVLPWGTGDDAKMIDFTPPFRRATYDELLREHVGVGLDEPEKAVAEAQRRGLEVAGKAPEVVVGMLFEEFVEDRLVGPVFVCDYPAALCPLTKRKRNNPAVAERFELFVHGMELANAYTELNDPLLQERLFSQQLAGLPAEESMAKMDHDFITALKHGMPPAGGLGIGIDRLVMLLTNSSTIRDVVIFPQMRPRQPLSSGDEATDA